jgi:hypothetical protein
MDGSASNRRGELFFNWNKATTTRTRDSFAVWTLSLDLVSSANRHRGALVVRRLYSQRNLQLDINLLTSDFPVALADALDRTLQHAVEVIPGAAQEDQGFMTAQAG